MAQAAYDLDMFEKPSRQKTPRVKAVKGRKAETKSTNQKIGMMAGLVIMVVLTCALIAGNVRITEITGEIQRTERALVNAKSEYNYLSGELDSKTSQRNVEEIAMNQLGLMKLDKSQITYFALENEETIRRPESMAKRIADYFTTGMLSLADYLNP